MHSLYLTLLLLSATPPAAVDCPRISDGGVEIDGFFKDWREGRGVRERAGGTLHWELKALRDSRHLYLVFGARDDSFAPTVDLASSAGRAAMGGKGFAGDHVRLSFPTAGEGGGPIELLVVPGDLEDVLPRVLRVGPKGAARVFNGAKIDGATRPGGGWVLEMALPLGELLGPAVAPDGLELSVAVHDADTSPVGQTRSQRALKLQFPEAQLNYSLMQDAFDLPAGAAPRAETLADVGGDRRQERVMAFVGVLAVLGEGLGPGAFYGYKVPFEQKGQPLGLRTVDLSGDGQDEMLLRLEVHEERPEGRHRQVFLAIFEFADGDLHHIFTAEIEHHGPSGQSVTNRVRIEPGKKMANPMLHIELERAEGMDVHTYLDVDAGYDNWYEEILLPWSRPTRRRFAYQNGRILRR